MDTRERLLATLNFEPLDRPLCWEFGYWYPTLVRWYQEGLPRHVGIDEHSDDDATVFGEALGIDWRNPSREYDAHHTLGFDEYMYRIPINNLFCPVFESRLLEDHADWYKVSDQDGQIVKISKHNGSRHFVDTCVKNRDDYGRVKAERLRPNLKDRLPGGWEEIKTKLKHRTFPLMYGGMQGFFNQSRRLLGFERLMLAFGTDPELIKAIADDTAELLIALYDPLLAELPGDYAMISEDMAYKNGCFVSPATFREFFMPAYKKLTGFYRDHGIRHIIVDCDGDVMGLIPLLIEGGVTGLHPFEVTGRNDIVEVRRRYPRFQILGGIGKKIVAQGTAAIDVELARLVPPLKATGGWIPFIDHTVPPEVSWPNFCYYRKRLLELWHDSPSANT
jgi:uroporphyrinogen decarboxylase